MDDGLRELKQDSTALAGLASAPVPKAKKPRPQINQPQFSLALRKSYLWGLFFILLGGLIATALVLGPFQEPVKAFLNHSQTEDFVVAVALFADAGDGETGRKIARQLAVELQQKALWHFRVIELQNLPADEDEAAQMATQSAADVLLWGKVTPGGLLDGETLQPNLIYQPTGPFAPHLWAGYPGRFCLPSNYVLAPEPINGRVILPELLLALANYSAGASDAAYERLSRLLADYSILNPALFRSLRGNILWAQGDFNAASAEYRLALNSPLSNQQRAQLLNNLGALQFDTDPKAARETWNEATRLSLLSNNLGNLHFNLGLLALQERRNNDAIVEFEQAQKLFGAKAALLLALGQAYRETGQLAKAEATFAQLDAQIAREGQNVPGVQQPLFQEIYRAAKLEQQGLLTLAQRVQSRGPLTWELEVAPVLPEQALNDLETFFRRARLANEAVMVEWQQQTSSSAPGMQLIGKRQATQAAEAMKRQKYNMALIMIEQGRIALNRPQSNDFWGFLSGLFDQNRSIRQARHDLSDLLTPNIDDLSSLVAFTRLLRVQKLNDQANEWYDRLIKVAPSLPEGYYGKGLLALAKGEREIARQFLQQALAYNSSFFPAHISLALLAEEDGRWLEAADHWRSIVQQYPHAANQKVTLLKLAQALRLSQSANFPEIQNVLAQILGEIPCPTDSTTFAYRSLEILQLAPPIDLVRRDALLELGFLYRETNKIDAAMQAFRDARCVDQRFSQASFELGRTLALKGNDSAAKAEFIEAISDDKKNMAAKWELATAHHRLGQTYLAQRQFDQAEKEEQQALVLTQEAQNAEAQPIRAAALVGLGDLAFYRGKLAQAEDFYHQALAHNPVLIRASVGLGQVAATQGDWPMALRHFETAVSYPGGTQDSLALFWLAEGLLRQSDQKSLKKAEETYHQVLSLKSVFPEALLGLAQTQIALGKQDLALSILDEALRQRPSYPEALLCKGKLLQNLGRNEEALKSYDQAINADSKVAEIYQKRGILIFERGDTAAALPDFEQALTLREGNYPEAQLYLGLVQEKLGKTKEAKAMLRKVIEVTRDNQLVSKAQAELERIEK